MDTRCVIRFAPSPNGFLHLGHAFSALFSFRVAQALGGRFLVRIEDIDQARARPEFVRQIFDDLTWLGLTWEEPVLFQSGQMEDYRAALDRLDKQGLLYRCPLTRKQIAEAVTVYEGAGAVWLRDPDGAPLLPPPDGAHLRATGAAGPTAGRLRMASALGLVNEPLAFVEAGPDVAESPVVADPARWGDVVLARKDIGTSYHLSVVVDDARQGVTHVTRGADLFEATHLHRLLQHLLGLPVPVYHHHPLIADDDGRKLSKSVLSKSLRALRAEGLTADEARRIIGIDSHAPYFESLGTAP